MFGLWIPELKFILSQGKDHGLRLAGLERDSLESFELTNGSRSGPLTLVDVDLCYGIARHGTGINHVHACDVFVADGHTHFAQA